MQLIAVRMSCSLKVIAVACAIAPLASGCAGLSDFSMKDQEWFSRPGKIFGARNLSLETPPLSLEAAVTQNDLITADGGCPGLAPTGSPSDANALQATGEPGAGAASRSGTVALGHTECDVARAIGSPDNVNISNGPRGDRRATITYLRGPRPGMYTFTAGRLTSVERVDAPAQPAKTSKPKKRAPT